VGKKASYKRFDGIAVLAVVGCIAMILFECVFIFELYRLTPSQIERFLPEAAKPYLKRRLSEQEMSAVLSVKTSAPVADGLPAETNTNAPAAEAVTNHVSPAVDEPVPSDDLQPVG
jgi:hypothetical protein